MHSLALNAVGGSARGRSAWAAHRRPRSARSGCWPCPRAAARSTSYDRCPSDRTCWQESRISPARILCNGEIRNIITHPMSIYGRYRFEIVIIIYSMAFLRSVLFRIFVWDFCNVKAIIVWQLFHVIAILFLNYYESVLPTYNKLLF